MNESERDYEAANSHGMSFSRFRAPQLFGNWIGREQIERLYDAARSLEARDVMSSPVVTVTEDKPIEKAIQIMGSRGFKRIPVVRGNIPVGIIARNDLLKLMARKLLKSDGVVVVSQES